MNPKSALQLYGSDQNPALPPSANLKAAQIHLSSTGHSPPPFPAANRQHLPPAHRGVTLAGGACNCLDAADGSTSAPLPRRHSSGRWVAAVAHGGNPQLRRGNRRLGPAGRWKGFGWGGGGSAQRLCVFWKYFVCILDVFCMYCMYLTEFVCIDATSNFSRRKFNHIHAIRQIKIKSIQEIEINTYKVNKSVCACMCMYVHVCACRMYVCMFFYVYDH